MSAANAAIHTKITIIVNIYNLPKHFLSTNRYISRNNSANYTFMSNTWNWLAFISYKHDDIEMARWLQEKLERYKLPSYLIDDYPDIRQNLHPIFRDETDLGLGYLDDKIKDNLQQAQYLIVICSRTTPQSPYVCDEIKEFIRQGKKDNIIPLLLEGTPEECFPAPLLEGKVPLGANVNEISREYATIKIIAALLGGVAVDKLWQRHLRAEEEEKERLLAEKRRLQIVQSRFLSEKAADLIEQGDIYTARMVLMEALPVKADDPYDRPLVNEAADLLRRSIDKEHSGATLLLHRFKSQICDLDVSHNGKYAAVGLYTDITSYGIPAIQTIEIATGRTITVANSGSNFNHGLEAVRFSSDDRYMLGFGFDSDLLVLDTHTQKSTTYNLTKYISQIDSAAWLGETHTIVLAGGNPENTKHFRIALLDIDNRTCDPYSFNHETSVSHVECSNDGRYIAFSTTDRHLCVFDLCTHKTAARLEGPSNIQRFCFNPANSNEIAGTFSKENCLFLLHIDRREMDMISNEHMSHSGFTFSPDGHFLAYEEGTAIKVADLQTKTAFHYNTGDNTTLSSITYSQDGKYIVFATADGIYCIHTKNHIWWKVTSDAKDKIIKFCGDTYRLVIGSSSTGNGMLQSLDFSYSFDHTNYDIQYASLSHDSNYVAYINRNNRLYIADTEANETDFITEFSCHPCFKTRPILFSSSDRYLTSLMTDGSLYVLDLHTRENFHSKRIKENLENCFRLGNMPEDTLLHFIENENAIAAIIDEFVCVWYFREDRYRIKKLDFKPDNLSYNSKNNVLVMVKGYEKGLCCKWYLSEDRLDTEELTNVRAYGNWIIMENKQGYSICNVETEKVRQVNVMWNVRSIVISPDGKYVALESAYSTDIHVIDMEKGKDWNLGRYSNSDVTPFVQIFFEDSGHVLVSSCNTNITRWFLDTGEKIVYKNAEHIFGTEHKAATIEKGTLKITSNAPIQDMIDKTRELFKDREFTEEEKQTFYLSDI